MIRIRIFILVGGEGQGLLAESAGQARVHGCNE